MLCQTDSASPLYSGMSGSRGVTFPKGGFVDKIKPTWVLECTQAHLRWTLYACFLSCTRKSIKEEISRAHHVLWRCCCALGMWCDWLWFIFFSRFLCCHKKCIVRRRYSHVLFVKKKKVLKPKWHLSSLHKPSQWGLAASITASLYIYHPDHQTIYLTIAPLSIPVFSSPPPTTGRSTTHSTVCPSHLSVLTTVWRWKR